MTAFIETALYVSVTALFVLLFKQLFKNKLSARWQVLIWLILAVRMIVPSLPQSRFSVFNAFDLPKEQKEVQTAFSENEQETDFNTVLPATPETETIKENPSETVNFTPPTEETAPTPAVTPKAGNSRLLSADFIVPFIIRCGAAVLLLYFVLVYIINLAKIKKQGKKAKDNALQLLHDCKNTVGVKRKVSLVYYGKSPMLMGVIKPVIVLPEDFSDKEKQDIIIHELCYLKNGDIFALWLALFLLCTSWYNPIIWLCFFTFRRDIEVYCDSRVLEYAVNKKEYAELLVRTALKKNSFIAGTTSLQNGEKEVERRIKYMAYFKKPKVIWIMIIAAIAIVIGVLCLTNAKSSEKDTAKKQEAIYLNEVFPHNDGDVIAYTGEFLFDEIKPFDGEVQVEQIKNTDDGTIYCLSILNPGVDLTDNLMANPDCSKIYFKVTEDEIYLYENGVTTLIMSTKTAEKTDFSELSNNGTTSIYRYHNTAVETGYYERFVFEKGIGLTEYARGYGAKRDHIELNMKNSKIIESIPNFFLKQTVTDEDEAYYCEVYDNSGSILFSDTSARCPVFNHLDGSLYELQTGFGTFAWQSIYINVETGYISEPYDNPFYLTSGIIAYVNTAEALADDGTTADDITLIRLYDLHEQKHLYAVDADFLKESSVTYQIEYEDNTHIAVTYYTENGQKENKKVIEVPPLSYPLTEADFAVAYNGFTFTPDTTVKEITSYFPTSERWEEPESYVFVAGCPSARRIQLRYPGYENPDIEITCIQNLEYGNSFIESIVIYDEDIKTARGISPGDSVLLPQTAYGKGLFTEFSGPDISSTTYEYQNRSIGFVDDDGYDTGKITHIILNYNQNSHESHAIDIYLKSLMGESVSSLPIDGEIKLLYASGAGAWGDYLHINPDGSFSGEYHDSEMGIADENNYPNGTVFIDRYSGRFGDFIKIDDYTYLLTVLEETHEFEPNAEWIEDGIRFVSTSPENPDIGTEYVLCLPGKPLSEIPKSVKEWELGNDSENTLTGYCLYPAQSPEIGYFQTT